MAAFTNSPPVQLTPFPVCYYETENISTPAQLFRRKAIAAIQGWQTKDEACPVDNGNKHLAVLCFSRMDCFPNGSSSDRTVEIDTETETSTFSTSSTVTSSSTSSKTFTPTLSTSASTSLSTSSSSWDWGWGEETTSSFSVSSTDGTITSSSSYCESTLTSSSSIELNPTPTSATSSSSSSEAVDTIITLFAYLYQAWENDREIDHLKKRKRREAEKPGLSKRSDLAFHEKERRLGRRNDFFKKIRARKRENLTM
ncbi:hypothetical protein pdam_00014946 [Pocillopora damicornis]|uniref:Uncharacterized protein n=1 Tax=Pocillopora damicornis TaxID=46731 RepID=A0A3M6TPY0_POCDA|nr:hypothetical protein pdam_00014946 [Pocillopora damicornis]